MILNWLPLKPLARTTCMAKVTIPRRGEIWLVDFDPAVGAEIQKVRPAVVIGVNSIGRLPLRMVVPITDWKIRYVNYPWIVELPASPNSWLAKNSGADAFQTKSVSQTRFVRLLGQITVAQLDDIASAIALCVGAPWGRDGDLAL
jgi:mRNA interferase MazF